MRMPVVSRKPNNIANPRTEPSNDIFILSNFDFINITNNKTNVVFKPAIFAALMGQKGLINTIGWPWSSYAFANSGENRDAP